jgi:hypothetical protein
MSNPRQAKQSKFNSHKVGKIRNVKMELKIIKVGELNIKEVLEFFVTIFFLFQDGVLIWEYRDKKDRIVVWNRTFLRTYTKLLNYELLCFVFL